MSAGTTPSIADQPYPGLRPFRSSEADIFFGREEQVDLLLERLSSSRFLAIVGVSGCGKSSLVRAGLIPALEAGLLASAGSRWRIATMRPGDQPLRNLAETLRSASGSTGPGLSDRDSVAFLEATLRRGPLGLVEALRGGPSGRPNHLLLVDQFEEIFRFRAQVDRDEADAFMALVLESVRRARDEALPLYVVLTMRSDFLGQCALFPGLTEALNDSQFLTPRLTRDQRRMAIERPAEVFDGRVEDDLVNHLLNDMGPEPDQLPLMQHALMRLWSSARQVAEGRHAEGQPAPVSMTLGYYLDPSRMGGLAESLSRHADEAYDALNDEIKLVAEVLFRCLTELDAGQRATRRPSRLEAVARVVKSRIDGFRAAEMAARSVPDADAVAPASSPALGLEEAMDLVRSVIESQRHPDHSFLTPAPPEPLRPETVLDIGHESLIRSWVRLKGWVDEEAESAGMYRRIVQTAELWGKGRAYYWYDPDLKDALEWKARERPTAAWAERYGGDFELAMKFLEKSQQNRESQRIFRRLMRAAFLWDLGRGSLWDELEPDLPLALGWVEREKPTREWAESLGGDLELALTFLKQSDRNRLSRPSAQAGGEGLEAIVSRVIRPAGTLSLADRMNRKVVAPSIGSGYRPRLAVYVVWHPRFERGQYLADRIYTLLTGDSEAPDSRNLGIPVFFRSASTGQALPAHIPIDEARHTVVVALVDEEMVAADGWGEYVAQSWGHANRSVGQHRIIPVSLSRHAFNLHERVAAINFLRLDGVPTDQQATHLGISLVNELCRILLSQSEVIEYTPDAPRLDNRVRIFISHTRQDSGIAALFRDYIVSNSQIHIFWDVDDISYGSEFREVLQTRISEAALLVVLTDTSSARDRNKLEILAAKNSQTPILVVDALRSGESRSFPYLGNVPTARLGESPNVDEVAGIIGRLLLEVLRRIHFRQHFGDLCDLFGLHADIVSLASPPELLTLLDLRRKGVVTRTVVYPDPPLGDGELAILHAFDAGLTLTTPTLLLGSGRSAPRLAGMTVGVSVFESPDLGGLGLGVRHVQDAMTNLARYLLARGASLASGSIVRPGGFADILLDFIQRHGSGDDPGRRLNSFLAWPIHANFTATDMALWRDIGTIVMTPRPPDLPGDPTVPPGRDTVEDPLTWARCLTAMRERMNGEIDASVLLGGKLAGYRGRYPGVAEEAYLALRSDKPVYLVGGFGGCTRDVFDAVVGRAPEALTLAWQEAHTPSYRELVKAYNHHASANPGIEPIDYEALVHFFQELGILGLAQRNGLTPEENHRLSETHYIEEIVYLVLLGLTRVYSHAV